MNRPTIRTNIVEAIIGEIRTFTDAHAGMAEQQEDIGRQIIATHQLLANEVRTADPQPTRSVPRVSEFVQTPMSSEAKFRARPRRQASVGMPRSGKHGKPKYRLPTLLTPLGNSCGIPTFPMFRRRDETGLCQPFTNNRAILSARGL